jgi:hypothetical protein
VGKDIVYSMRMTSKVRDALRKAAALEHRTMASLLDKIVADYLEKQGYLYGKTVSQERRKHQRTKTALAAVTHPKAGGVSSASISCVVLDLSLGGALVAYPRGSEIKDTSIGEMPNFSLCFKLPRIEDEVCFKCDVRRVFNIGNGLKIGAAFTAADADHLERLGAYLA